MSAQATKYARVELERRFLVVRVPEGLTREEGWLITDRYIVNTRLRLRRMDPLASGEAVFKLGQKEAPYPSDFSRLTITNMYLSRDEYEVFGVLTANELRKRRYRLDRDGCIYSVDVFEDHLAGLVLAEVGFDTIEEMDAHKQPPDFTLRDVSHDVRFTGAVLAAMTPRDARRLLEGLS
jgi:CYTH domain-containing protein